ncbi:hypothetical protein [Candidatus Formimonas warabiya]|uniref:Metal-dependent hydrolase n=1 Tax=Formimonas warabiya TaxID=1761012 RepID=A0A3G1KW02_FORW1|nr:hypothetical protein [Candidatus Formimonas warabiya]ATW26539.1 hypothetical protein DCMF_18885 [Candidatus Formimonas warabiya]
MFIGHYGVGFALKKLEKRVSLGLLFLLVMLPDILWDVFLLLGVEKANVIEGPIRINSLAPVYTPVSHSLLSNFILAVLICFAFKVFNIVKFPVRAMIFLIAILSHFFLDFLVSPPELPLLFSGIKVGLGLGDHVLLSYLIEAGIFLLGICLYFSTMRELNTGKTMGIGILSLILLGLNFFALTEKISLHVDLFAAFHLALNAVVIGLAFWLDTGKTAAYDSSHRVSSVRNIV